MARKRRIKSVKTELVKKAREAMLAAVQLYNNPQVTFKAESFITLAIIGWTYTIGFPFTNIPNCGNPVMPEIQNTVTEWPLQIHGIGMKHGYMKSRSIVKRIRMN